MFITPPTARSRDVIELSFLPLLAQKKEKGCCMGPKNDGGTFFFSRCVCLCVCELVVRTCIGGRLAFQILSFGLERSRNRKEGSKKKRGREKEGKGGKSLELTSPFIRETDWESLKRYQQGLSIPEPASSLLRREAAICSCYCCNFSPPL